jgi:hypothetical protein
VIELSAEQHGYYNDHHEDELLVVLSALLIGVAELCQVILPILWVAESRGRTTPSLLSMINGLRRSGWIQWELVAQRGCLHSKVALARGRDRLYPMGGSAQTAALQTVIRGGCQSG